MQFIIFILQAGIFSSSSIIQTIQQIWGTKNQGVSIAEERGFVYVSLWSCYYHVRDLLGTASQVSEHDHKESLTRPEQKPNKTRSKIPFG
jgi:hypothetical protein